MTRDLDSIRHDLRRLLALLALEQLNPCDAIDWAQSVAAHVRDSHGLRVLAGCDRKNAGVWLHHAAQDLSVAFPIAKRACKSSSPMWPSSRQEGSADLRSESAGPTRTSTAVEPEESGSSVILILSHIIPSKLNGAVATGEGK